MTEADLERLRLVARDYAKKWLPQGGGHEVEDVARCAFTDFVKYAATNEVRNPDGMIGVMARRRARKYRNDWKADRGSRPPDVANGMGLALAAQGDDPAAALISQKEPELLKYAISQLRPVDREIARLTYECDPPLSGTEVAERTGLPAGTVRNRLVQIHRLLAELLETPPE